MLFWFPINHCGEILGFHCGEILGSMATVGKIHVLHGIAQQQTSKKVWLFQRSVYKSPA